MTTQQQPTGETPPVGPDRRTVLRGAAAVGAVGAVGALAACAGDDSSGDPGSPGGGDTRPEGVITRTADVPVGGGQVVVRSNSKVVVTQPEAGTFKAFSAICTHQACQVGTVVNNRILCPCHGSQFDAATGEVVQPPATSPLATVEIKIEGDEISYA